MSRSRAGSGILGIVAVTAAVIGSARVAHAQAPGAAGPPTSGPPQGGYPPPPPPSGYPPPPPPSGYPPPPPAQPPEPDGIHRSGFIIGFSLGWGSISCSSCPDGDSLSGAAVDIHLGGMLAPNVALMFDGSGIGHTIDGSGTLTHVVDTLAVQVWASERFWLKAGVGVGRLSLSDNGSEALHSETRAAGMVAIGLELFQGRSSALDVQLRGAATSFSDGTLTNSSIHIGYSWY